MLRFGSSRIDKLWSMTARKCRHKKDKYNLNIRVNTFGASISLVISVVVVGTGRAGRTANTPILIAEVSSRTFVNAFLCGLVGERKRVDGAYHHASPC